MEAKLKTTLFIRSRRGMVLTQEGEVDFAIIERKDRAQEMAVNPLKPEQYILVGSSAWKNRKLKDIVSTERIIDFNPDEQMTSLIALNGGKSYEHSFLLSWHPHPEPPNYFSSIIAVIS